MGARLQNWFNKTIWDTSSQKDVGPTYDLKGTQAYDNNFWYFDNFSDERVTERRAMQITAVYVCMNIRSQTMAALPGGTFQVDDKGNRVEIDHDVSYLLNQEPNNYMSAANMELTSMIHADGWGNSYYGINRNSRNNVTSLDLLVPWEVTPTKYQGEAYYKVNGLTYASRDILHFRWFSLDGLCGLSAIKQNMNTMGMAIKQERYSAKTLGAKPPGFLSFEQQMTPEQRKQNKEEWQKSNSGENLGSTPVLSNGAKYVQTIIPPEDMQMLDTYRANKTDIYGIYRIPPTFAQDFERATFTNAEQQDLVYVKHTVSPIVVVREKEIRMKLFTEKEKKNTYYKYNLNGLLRGDLKARSDFYTAMRNIGGLNANEIRNLEDRNNYEGGEIYTVQAANIPVDQLRDFYKNKVLPTATPSNGKSKEYTNGHVFN